ncbi:MAG: Clp protease N-terminal domain-containing protein [Chloroflexota bacterium]
MPNIALKDILIGARQEAYRMRHFYVGAEHLFIALLEIRGSLASNIVQEHGLTPEYVIDAIRRKVGKGGRHRLWAGVPNTPRADVLLNLASDLAMEDSREEISERDLLIALFEENDSMPLRVLAALGLDDIAHLGHLARTHTLDADSQQPYVKVDFGPDFDRREELTKGQLFILRRMFHGYNQVRVDRRLTGGYSKATLLVVTPIGADSREDAPVVVKLNRVDSILDEARRYESHVKTKLPPMTARIEEKPFAPETSDLAGIKYTLVAGYDRVPRDLRAVIGEWEADRLGRWLTSELFPTFGRIWWQQNRPYRFQVWREYDWLLPPILTLEYAADQQLPPTGYTLRMPVKRAKLRRLDYGDLVGVENFIVQRVYPERNAIQLALGHGTDAARAYKIEVRGVDFTNVTYYRGEVIDSIVGTVWQTRNQQLVEAVRALMPDFDAHAEKVALTEDIKIPNPIIAYEGLLDSYVNGTLSTIHGDLHPGNIMIGPNSSAFLIDFAHTRDGHTIFDWATLEASLIADYIGDVAGDTWDDARAAALKIMALDGGHDFADDTSTLGRSLHTLTYVRGIVAQCLAEPDKWAEYYIALAFCGLRTLTWDTISEAGRRLMFLVAGLAIHELRTRFRPSTSTSTPSPDDTEINTLP